MAPSPKKNFRSRLALWLFLLLPLACAIPVMPTGGPVDEQPPIVDDSTPANESVNVETDNITIVFSEYIDQASFAQSVSLTPAFDRPLAYRWKRRQVQITFPEALRENTTYILSIDTNLRDANRVALKEPITLAFATGPQINRGRLAGRVIDALGGEGVAGFDIFAYATPDSLLPAELPERPDYRTQTDENGAFSLEYLSEQPYFVIALQDRNRNRMPDGIESFAVPPTPFILADSSNTDDAGAWLVTTTDTIAPEVQRVRSLSSRRFSLRLSESIQLLSRDPQNWALRDSVSNQTIPVEDIYLYPEDPRTVYFVTQPLFASRHLVVPGGLADSSGNPVAPDETAFTPSSATDTLQLRFQGFFVESTSTATGQAVPLPSGRGPQLRFNQPPPQEALTQYVSIADSSGQTTSFESTSGNGAIYELTIAEDFSPQAPFTVRVDGAGFGAPDTTFERIYQQLTEADLGELSGTVVAADSAGQPIVQLYPADDPKSPEVLQTPAQTDGRFIFSGLTGGTPYRFRAYVDFNDNQRWDGGQILPYLDAEPIAWYSDSLQVRARWEQSLADTLRIPTR